MAEPENVPELQPAPAKIVRGYVDCPLCLPAINVATVMETKKPGRLYFKCPIHDVQLMTNSACQHWITTNMRDTPQRQAGDPEPAPAPIPKKEPEPKPQPKRGKDWLESW